MPGICDDMAPYRSLSKMTLTLFMTKAVGLHHWQSAGLLDREMALYQALGHVLKQVNIVTYGGDRDRVYQGRWASINILPSSYLDSEEKTVSQLLDAYPGPLWQTDLFKTNQMKGASVPLRMAKVLGKKILLRMGYPYAYFVARQSADPAFIRDAVRLEAHACQEADHIVVTSRWQKENLLGDHGLASEKIDVIPNYVVDAMSPHPRPVDKTYDIVYVGRATRQKNLNGLMQAIHILKNEGVDVRTLMIGSCGDDPHLQRQAKDRQLSITFTGCVAHGDVPKFLSQARLFVLPSFYEGHPKVLLEAMACGMPCVATDVDGIRDLIWDHHNGLLCTPHAESIAKTIKGLLSDIALQNDLAENAFKTVRKDFRLDCVIEKELALYHKMLSQQEALTTR